MGRADGTIPRPLPHSRLLLRPALGAVLVGLLPAGFAAWRLVLPERALADTGPRALADGAFALAFWAYLLTVGAGAGYTALRLVGFKAEHPADRLRFGVPIGVALLGFIPLGLGLLGLLRPGWVIGCLAIVALAVAPASRLGIRDILGLTAQVRQLRRSPLSCFLGTLYVGLGLATVLLGLTPPTGYDDLWYHLEAPRLFLAAGRIYPEANNWNANYAFALDLLYAFPLALGNDTVPRLVHWTFGALLLANAYGLARRYVPALAWVTPAAVLTMNQLPFLAIHAATDLPVACFELLALEGIVAHIRGGERLNLRLVTLCLGLGLATKATAAGGATALGVVLAGYLARCRWLARSAGFPVRPLELVVAGLLGLSLVGPWYGKNWLWFGHPLFPYAGGPTDRDGSLRTDLLTAYVRDGYGVPKDLLGLVSLPGALLTEPDRFGFGLPPLALVALAPFGAFLLRRPGLELLAFAALRVGFWFLTSQQIRFLISGLVVVTVLLVAGLGGATLPRARRLAQGVAAGVTLSLLLVIALTYLTLTVPVRQWGVIFGYESKEQYLTRMLAGFRALTFISSLPPESRVLLVGDARHYYCPAACWPEADQFTWTRLAMLADFDPERLVEDLRAMGITHILVSRPDVEFLTDHDPGGRFGRSISLLYGLVPRCLKLIFVDRATEVYEVGCAGPEAAVQGLPAVTRMAKLRARTPPPAPGEDH